MTDRLRVVRMYGAQILRHLVEDRIIPNDDLLRQGYHQLHHVRADMHDARLDERYKEWQNNVIREIIIDLEEWYFHGV